MIRKILLSAAVVVLLGGCSASPEDVEREGVDDRIIDSAEKLCESHNGTYMYTFFSSSFIYIQCFDKTTYNVRTGEEF